MTDATIVGRRLLNQRLAGVPFEKPEDAVGWFGAVQSQDYPAAKWAVAQRTTGVTDADFDRLFAEGKILRTHVLRPTWHFVLPQDIGWMLKLTGPRVLAGVRGRHRQLELDETIFSRANQTLSKHMQGGRHITRAEVVTIMSEAGVNIGDTERFTHVMMQAELTGLVCSGAMQGKQNTYVLLDERVLDAKSMERETALAELAKRYLISHGPATIKDFVWWSGLTVADARASFESLKPLVMPETINGQTYWQPTASPPTRPIVPTVFLLPNYDEYTVAYAERSAFFDPAMMGYSEWRGSAIFDNVIVINGIVKGNWKRTIKKDSVLMQTRPFQPLDPDETAGLAQAVQRYGDFIGLPVTQD